MRRAAIIVALCILAPGLPGGAHEGETLVLDGLSASVEVLTDRDGVRHILASNDLDLARAQGFVHASDRFFQMDATRREVSGDLAELLGSAVIGSDIQSRTIGLRRAAERSLDALTPRERAIMEAYADGVNAFLETQPLPIEYGALELTQARPWTAVDSLVIGKAIAAGLSLDVDLELDPLLAAYAAAGAAQGFDGEALLLEDVNRSAPMDPAATVPDASGEFPFVAALREHAGAEFLARAAEHAERARDKARRMRLTARALERVELPLGSNEWGVAARRSLHGQPMIANDPHLSLDAPSTFYEMHLVVHDDPEAGSMNVSGVGFPGAPGVILGQTTHVSWGATTNPMDVSDVFLDTVIIDPGTCGAVGSLACVQSAGALHPVVIQFNVTYRANVIGDGVPDNLVPVPVPQENQILAWVPFRSFGPVLDIGDPSVLLTGGVTTALVLQYTGFHATRELATFLKWNRARNLDDFLDGLADFDVGSQNWAYTDTAGNLAYFSSAEMPLRTDLEQGVVAGRSPLFIRDGSGPANWVPDPARSQGQSIPFAILPFEEMPHLINPKKGWFVNANNDPAGTTLDNDPLNQGRLSNPSAIYYLNPGYANGLRAGRITRLVRDHVDSGRRIGLGDMMRFQANTQQLDAELLVPHLVGAFDRARRKDAPDGLAELAGDRGVREAVARLRHWDYSTPTGIPEGWDASDLRGVRRTRVPLRERAASVAATLHNVWRGQLLRSVIDARLAALGVPGVGSSAALKAVHHLLTREPFTGVGASGVDFFPDPAGWSAKDRRDRALLRALRDALDLLASPEFEAAFGGSPRQSDYRWGKLHRITFDHPLGAPFSIPPAAGFEDLSPELSGLSRDGGYEVVNASGFSARAASLDGFKFGGGPVRRYVGLAGLRIPFFGLGGILGFNVVPGGPSGDPTSPDYATQLPVWLTSDYHFVRMGRSAPGLRPESKLALVPAP